ncbi:MAG: metal-dependent phosphohydrolase, partial [Clostridiaceae bacterium]|nr:metal-dependent phosphohydrolase [Clostridiaceae bacterium]
MIQDHPIIQEIKQSGYLPQIPKDFGEAMSMLLRPYEYDMDECIERLYSLPNVASIIIRVINHVAAFNRKIRGLKDAVLYLGADNVRMIAIAHMTRLLL